MRVVAFGFGRKFGNTETVLKEALMACEEKGLEVVFCRVPDMDMMKDAQFMRDLFLDSDGVMFGAPVYSITPNSTFLDFRDRVFGPQMDLAFWQAGREPKWARGRGRQRPGCLVSVGGAPTHHWVSMGIPTLYTAAFSPDTKVVDFMDITTHADMGACAVDDELMKRAHKMGEHLADAVLSGDYSWRGDDIEGFCPTCHLNYVELIPGTNRVECPLCGNVGTIEVKDGKVNVTYTDFHMNVMTMEGKKYHDQEIKDVRDKIYNPLKPLVPEKMAKYKAYEQHTVISPTKGKQEGDGLDNLLRDQRATSSDPSERAKVNNK